MLLHCYIALLCAVWMFFQKLRSCWIFLTAVVTLSCVASVCFTYFVKWASNTATNFLVALIYILTNAFCLWYLALSKNESPIPPLQTACSCCSTLPIPMYFSCFRCTGASRFRKESPTNPAFEILGGADLSFKFCVEFWWVSKLLVFGMFGNDKEHY